MGLALAAGARERPQPAARGKSTRIARGVRPYQCRTNIVIVAATLISTA